MKPKDPVPVDRVNGVVYRVPCKVCSKAYVGQSGRSLSCRLKEHQRAVHNGDVMAIDWEASEVLDSCRFQYPRCMLESWHIH